MGKPRTSTHTENLTISRIHVVLRPFETKLNVLAKTLSDRKVADTKYAPTQRIRGVTYAKRHRIRALTGLNVRQASRAYDLEKSRGLSTRFGFHEQVIGVEDAFRNLVRATQAGQPVDHGILSLQAMLSKMIGRQVAEETLRDKEELEEEGIDDCIGLWYGGLTVHCRKDALVAHAIELVVLKIPVFILELWKGLLTITMQAHLLEESSILLEDILLYYLTSNPDPSDPSTSTAAHTAGRDLTDLYTQYIVHLPSNHFFSVLLPILEASPPSTWRLRAVQHLIRHVDNDFLLTCRLLERMAVAGCYFINTPSSNTGTSKTKTSNNEDTWLLKQIEIKSLSVLGQLITDAQILTYDTVHEITHLSWTLWVLGQHLKRQESAAQVNYFRIMQLACALDVQALLLSSSQFDVSDITERLSTPKLVDGPDKEGLFFVLVQALELFAPRTMISDYESSTKGPDVEKHCTVLAGHELQRLADRLKASWEKMASSTDGTLGYTDLATDISSLKRKWMDHGEGSKSRKLCDGGRLMSKKKGKRKMGRRGDESEDESGSEESEGEWSASVSGEDTAGEVDEEESVDSREHTDGEERSFISVEDADEEEEVLDQRHGLRFVDDEEEESDRESSPDANRYPYVLQPSNGSFPFEGRGPAPVLQSVVDAKIRGLMQSRLTHAYERDSRQTDEDEDEEDDEEDYFDRKAGRGYGSRVTRGRPSSDDDLDLLGKDAWSTP